ncbi:hypothetical protein ACFOED_10840 [Vulcaniibacterium thermophilum]|uniref:Uncharacterized protein n=1 Tax=Vulcaniibacterium thermophilum TaxID=1169913 RepID=A0A918YW87_9GAMM|nr:hypothetical protein [Vulcaniibacterium thermophilum]GHE27503.1 hypothetical protein GCM10007167_06180 [Vulcaniibacterium thermophilum]
MKASELYKGMLVLQGHIVRPSDLEPAPASRAAIRHRPARPLWRAVRDALVVLGGRPMHAGHNLDVEEPFELSR